MDNDIVDRVAGNCTPFGSTSDIVDNTMSSLACSLTEILPANTGIEIPIVQIIDLETRAAMTQTLEDVAHLWTIKFYSQRKYWFWIFLGFVNLYDILFCNFIMSSFPTQSYTKEYFQILRYLSHHEGVPLWQKMFRIKSRLSLNRFLTKLSPFTHLYNIISATDHIGLTRKFRQSKLSQEQLTELQRSTHFDKKELQQWYKGVSYTLVCSMLYI
jgi:hypothetical protein